MLETQQSGKEVHYGRMIQQVRKEEVHRGLSLVPEQTVDVFGFGGTPFLQLVQCTTVAMRRVA